jgi:hypothetical protein
MKIKCTNNTFMKNLTLGSEYEVLEILGKNKIQIIDDSGRKNTYYISRFLDITPKTLA